MKDKTCFFTGHRSINTNDIEKIKLNLYHIIEDMISRGIIYFGCGGALGFDTLAAQTILNFKKQYPQIKLIMVYPCKNQTKYWKAYDIDIYNHIKKHCDKYVYISQNYTYDCMFKRNRHLADHSAHCVCYLNKSYGGTFYTVNYAMSKGVKIINIAAL